MADTVWDLNKAIEGPSEAIRNRSDSDPGVQFAEEKALDIAHPGGFRRDHLKNNDLKVSPHLRHQILKRITSVYDPFINSMLSQDNDQYDDMDLKERIQMLLQTPGIRGPTFFSIEHRDEETALLQRKASTAEKTTTLWHAFFSLLKSFVGTGVLFLPQGFKSGGIVFSPIVLAIVAIFTLYCMLRLLECRRLVGGTYSHIGKVAYGDRGHRMVQVSIVLMQTGFCCAYIIFVAQNMYDVLAYINAPLSIGQLILLQAFLYIPLSWIRYISYFSISNLVADAFILYGLAFILGNSVSVLAEHGAQQVEYFNPQDYSVFIGTAIFTFEGIGLVIPTQASLNKKRQAHFGALLIGTMTGLLVFYTIFACVNYTTFGDAIQPVVTSSLPRNGWGISVQFGYSIAQLLSYPLFLFPAVKIIEDIFQFQSRDSGQKVQKNIIRSIIVLISVAIAYFGQEHLDLFVSIVGAFCCVPLSFIYPPLFYQKLVKDSHWLASIVDYSVVGLGIVTFFFVTYTNLEKW